jgi:hypothetical protein
VVFGIGFVGSFRGLLPLCFSLPCYLLSLSSHSLTRSLALSLSVSHFSYDDNGDASLAYICHATAFVLFLCHKCSICAGCMFGFLFRSFVGVFCLSVVSFATCFSAWRGSILPVGRHLRWSLIFSRACLPPLPSSSRSCCFLISI